MKRILFLFIMGLSLMRISAQQPDASELMSKSRELTLAGSMVANVHLSITEKSGTSRARTISMTTKTFLNGQEKRFIRFLEPADVKGTSMLIIDNKDINDEMWIYLPALKKDQAYCQFLKKEELL
ncbi:MAG: outer membrane lipoprotein-sorting protein [Bacteroidales bacterium]|nr:outer membrane lipoprotein-sorting protein [Bacteroidales bacterium]